MSSKSVRAPGRSEGRVWQGVLELMGERRKTLGPEASERLRRRPDGLISDLTRYKFAARMLGRGRRVLELGCGEGLGAPILAEFAREYTGVERDAEAVESARRLFSGQSRRFLRSAAPPPGRFDAVVAFGLSEDALASTARQAAARLCEGGVCVLGTSARADRLQKALRPCFANVFVFGAAGELVHPRLAASSTEVLALACGPL